MTLGNIDSIFDKEPGKPKPRPTKQITEDDFVYVPLDKVDSPKNGHMDVLLNRWWLVHPEKGLAFYNPKGRNGKRRSGHGNPYGSPQCNVNKAITERLAHPWLEIKFISTVYLPLITSDYGC